MKTNEFIGYLRRDHYQDILRHLGQTIYITEPNYKIIREDKISMIGFTKRGIRIKASNYHPHNKDFMLGKTAFVDKTEAELSLAKLVGCD